jgi:PAS domain S-box-containing protein
MNPTEAPEPTAAELAAKVVDAMLDAVIVADAHGVIRLWNRGAEVIFGFSQDEAIGCSLDLIVPTRFRPAHAAGYRKAIATGHLHAEGKVLTTRANHKYGCRLYVDFSFGLVKGEGGAVTGVFAVGRDVTARQLGEAALQAQAAH